MPNKFVVVSILSIIVLSSCRQSDSKKLLSAHYQQVAANAVHWNDYNSAANAWLNMYTLDKSNAPLLDSIFYAYNRTANYKAAAALGSDIGQAHMKDEAFIYALATDYKESGNFTAAIEASRLHISITKDTMPDYYNLGLCFLELHQYPNVIGCMSTVVGDTSSVHRSVIVKGQPVPYCAAALNVIGIAEIKQGNIARGEKAFTTALKAAPNFTSAANNLNALHAAGNR